MKPEKICDGYVDCRLGDESDEQCATCPTERPFKCSILYGPYKKCIESSKVCDCKDDCGDQRDEINCDICIPKSGKRVRCVKSKRWIDRNYVCNGRKNCKRHSEDERSCIQKCPKWKPFLCNNSTTKCIRNGAVCDGVSDCSDGEDETKCPTCPAGFVQCENTTDCIMKVCS